MSESKRVGDLPWSGGSIVGLPTIEDKHGNRLGTFLESYTRDLAVACVNALAGIRHPERLAALLEACKWAYENNSDPDLSIAASDAVSAAYAALYGE